jgi:hypothetical protein
MAPFEVGAPVAGDAFALEQQFDHLGGEPYIELLFAQGIGHRVVMPLDLDMVIAIAAGTSPFGVCIRL